MVTTHQIRCPFCNAAAPQSPSRQHTCEYCLQPFSVVDAEREQAKLVDEIKRWMDQKLGGLTAGGGGVDASSRAYIFRERILPELRRDVDRSLEMFGAYGQFALVQVPVRTNGGPNYGSTSPLLGGRQQILGLKNLRARLESDSVSAFAVGDDEKRQLQALDRRLADLMHLSNVADAAARGEPSGYAAARRNLESLVADLGRSVTIEAACDRQLAGFLSTLENRYAALAELCRVCEELGAAQHADSTSAATRLDAIAVQLDQAKAAMEACGYAPADTMPLVIGTGHEATSARTLARWVRSYGEITRRRPLPFLDWVRRMEGLTASVQESPETHAELLESWSMAVQAGRGEIAVPVLSDFGWVNSWVEQTRAKKSLGIFGDEERTAHVAQFFLPLWTADASFSRSSGAVFTSGVEGRAVLLLDACSGRPDGVVTLPDAHPALRALANPQPLSTRDLALPRMPSTAANRVFSHALRGRPDMLNAQVRVRGLAFASAAAVWFQSSKGQRTAVSCLGGLVPVDASAALHLQMGQQLFEQFG